MYLTAFQIIDPPFAIEQSRSLDWLANAYVRYQKVQTHSQSEYLKLLKRVGCAPAQVAKRFHYLPDFQEPVENAQIFKSAEASGTTARQSFFQETAQQIFESLYEKRSMPNQLIHVSCTGYTSPSAAQLTAARLSPECVVTHSYHMGCYGAFPALRMASGFLSSPQLSSEVRTDEPREISSDMPSDMANDMPNDMSVDIVHTEMCTLQMKPSDPSLEQMVIQSLFADGMAAYRAVGRRPAGPSLEILKLGEFLIPNSAAAMSWSIGDEAMSMTLSKDVPTLVASALREILSRWERQTGFEILKLLPKAIVAVHPGGPKIIDAVRELLELNETQVRHSRAVLYERGNMSSATVPHIWQKILQDETIKSGTPVLSLAFGPGLTVCLSWMHLCR